MGKVGMRNVIAAVLVSVISSAAIGYADDSYVEPGTLRLSHEFALESILHRVRPHWDVTNNDLDKTYTQSDTSSPPWSSEWGQSLLTEAATRLTPDIFGRVLFEAQGDYADRFWRPNNFEHHIDNADRNVFLRQAEARIDRDDWYAHAYKGVAHGNWADKGDLFGLYPEAIPDDDYLGRSAYFGMTPKNYTQDRFLNFSKRHAPRGFEAGGQAFGLDATVAYGNELRWGYDKGGYGRVAAPVGPGKLTFVYKNEDVPWRTNTETEERDRAYALSWLGTSADGNSLDVGVLYRPFRVGQTYLVDREADGGTGLLGSSHNIGVKTSERADAFAERVQGILHTMMAERDFVWNAGLTHAGVLAGNKNQLDLGVGTDVTPVFRGSIQYMYRKPIEGPLPFLYEGTESNPGAIVSSPRGPDEPFQVNWDNREAKILATTLVYDPTPGSSLFIYKPDALQMWNVNPREDSAIALAFQHRMRSYPTTTDRISYLDEEGNYQTDPASHSGAWATADPLHEFRILATGHPRNWSWAFGFAAGQDIPYSSLAYSNNSTVNKPITEYYSLEGRIDWWSFTVWGNYGTGVWGPESYQQDFGEAFDRLYGLGASYRITRNSTLDVSYLAARQDDSLFVAPDLGSYDEIRTVFSHRFGFLFQFNDVAQTGYRAR